MKLGSCHIQILYPSQPARKLRRTANFALPLRHLRARPRRNNTGKERDSETGLYYYGARYLDPKASRWLSGDPAVGEYVPSAPVNDEARKRNGSLPGMGGVFNYVNLHVYHYAGNNPVKYVDPDGENIYSLMFSDFSVKGVIGGGMDYGIAWDDNGNFSFVMSFSVGIGFEVSAGVSFTVTSGININDLPEIPLIGGRYDFDAYGGGISANGGFILGAIFKINRPGSRENPAEFIGGKAFTIGGGIDFLSITIYPNKKTIGSNFTDEQKSQFISILESQRETMQTETYNAIISILEQ